MERDCCKYRLLKDDIPALSNKHFYVREQWDSTSRVWMKSVFCGGFCMDKISETTVQGC